MDKDLDEIIKWTKFFQKKTKGNYYHLSEIIIEHPEIMLQVEKPDTDILYWHLKKKKITIGSLNRSEFKKRVVALSTIRNFRKELRDFLENKNIAIKTAYELKVKGRKIRYKMSKGG